MFVAKSNIDLLSHNVFEKTYDIKKDTLFLARDGILHAEIRANNVTILKEYQNIEIEDYIVFETEKNKKYFEKFKKKLSSNKEEDTETKTEEENTEETTEEEVNTETTETTETTEETTETTETPKTEEVNKKNKKTSKKEDNTVGQLSDTNATTV